MPVAQIDLPRAGAMPPLQRLRAACDPIHERLHVHPLLASLHGDGPADYEAFRRALAAFELAYRQLEAVRPHAVPDTVPDAPALDWLRQDLARHGVAPLPSASSTGPQAPALPSAAAEMGYLYVKQGSCLGGQVMARKLRRDLGLQPEEARFFNAYGADNGLHWRAFQARLGQLDDRQAAQAAGAARHCFRFMEECLNKALPC